MKTAPVKITQVDEPWAYANLADGSTIKVKLVFDKVSRDLDDDGKPAFAPNGEPLYNVNWGTVIACDAPDENKENYIHVP